MPSLKATRLSHIQDILSGRKKALLQRNVPAKIVPNWPELAVKNVYYQVLDYPGLKDYLPDVQGNDKRLPERDFFWKVLYCLYPENVDDMIKQASDHRQPQTMNLQE